LHTHVHIFLSRRVTFLQSELKPSQARTQQALSECEQQLRASEATRATQAEQLATLRAQLEQVHVNSLVRV
jgi:multidrug resistance efflux pump